MSSARRMRSATKPGRFDVVGLDVDDAQAERKRRVELLEQLQILVAAPRELERHGVDPRLENRREQVAIAALPRRFAVAVAVADVQAHVRVHDSTIALTARIAHGRSSGNPE